MIDGRYDQENEDYYVKMLESGSEINQIVGGGKLAFCSHYDLSFLHICPLLLTLAMFV